MNNSGVSSCLMRSQAVFFFKNKNLKVWMMQIYFVSRSKTYAAPAYYNNIIVFMIHNKISRTKIEFLHNKYSGLKY